MPKNYEEFEKIITEMGLKESEGLNEWGQSRPQVVGDYRNHRLKVYEVKHSEGDSSPPYGETNYDVEFENPQTIQLCIRKNSIFVWSRSTAFAHPTIKMNDSEFDKKFKIKGNKESVIRAIIDPSIRNRIMKIRDFNLIIGFHDGNRFNDFFVTNVAEYIDSQSFSKTKEDANRFRAIIEIIIDIIEKIET